MAPTVKPIVTPEAKPTETPATVEKATAAPVATATDKPTASPAEISTASPAATADNVTSATAVPTETPAIKPTAEPTQTPTAKPTEKPTTKPTQKPVPEVTDKQEQNVVTEPIDNVEIAPTQEPAATQAPETTVTQEPEAAQVHQNGQSDAGNTVITAVTPKPQTAPEEKSAITFEMKDNSTVYSETLEQIREQGRKVTLDMGNGASWNIDGAQMGDGPLQDVDFDVVIGKSNIPKAKRDALTEGENYIEFSLAHDGRFGFTAVLSISLESAEPGQYANLFYYDEATGEFQFMCASLVGSTKIARFEFVHASDYIIIISDEIKDNLLELRAPQMEEAERIVQEELNNYANEKPAEEPKKAAGIIVLIVFGSTAIVIAGYLIFLRKND